MTLRTYVRNAESADWFFVALGVGLLAAAAWMLSRPEFWWLFPVALCGSGAVTCFSIFRHSVRSSIRDRSVVLPAGDFSIYLDDLGKDILAVYKAVSVVSVVRPTLPSRNKSALLAQGVSEDFADRVIAAASSAGGRAHKEHMSDAPETNIIR